MEGAGGRLGRSSTRYAPTTVFTGPVRKWKKRWVHVSSSNSSNQHPTAANGNVNCSNGSSHLLLYKWTSIAPSQNNDNNDGNDESKNSDKDDDDVVEEPPKRKFKYIPIVMLEARRIESSELFEDGAKPFEMETETAEATSNSDGYDEKPDINDVPMDGNQAPEKNPAQHQDLNESLELSLGLQAHNGENESDSKAE